MPDDQPFLPAEKRPDRRRWPDVVAGAVGNLIKVVLYAAVFVPLLLGILFVVAFATCTVTGR